MRKSLQVGGGFRGSVIRTLEAWLWLLGVFPLLLPNLSAQVNETVTWTGGNVFGSYTNPANWVPSLIPLNSPRTNFTVILPDNSSVALDSTGSNSVDALSFPSGTFRLGPSQNLAIRGIASIGGQVEVVGPGSSFTALASNATFAANSRFLATSGGKIAVAGRGYQWTYDPYRFSPVVFAANGPDSAIIAPLLGSLRIGHQINDNGSYRFYVQAINGGRLTFPSLTTVEGATSDEWLEFIVSNGGELDLSALQQVTRRTFFNIDVPSFSLPALTAGSEVLFDSGPGSTFTARSLTRLASSTISVQTNAAFRATNLTEMASSVLDIQVGGLIEVPRLLKFTDSALTLGPGKNLIPGPFNVIDNSRFSVEGGSQLVLGATSYDWTYDPYRWSPVIFSAAGAGSRISAPSLNSLQIGHQINDNGSYRFSISAINGGRIDLSALTTVEGATSDEWLEFVLSGGGDIDLSALRQVTRRTLFNVQVPTYSLPVLSSASETYFSVGPGRVLNLPQLTSLNGTMVLGAGARVSVPSLTEVSGSGGDPSLDFNSVIEAPSLRSVSGWTFDLRNGGILNAPLLRTLVGSYVGLNPTKTFASGLLTNIDNSRFAVDQGAQLNLGASSYRWTYDPYRWSPVIFSADGADSLISAPQLNSFQIGHQINDNGSYRFYISAINGGRIDLSSVSTIEGATSDDWLELVVNSGGKLDLGKLSQITRRTLFNLDLSDAAAFTLPSLKAASETYFNVGQQTHLELPLLETLSGGGSTFNLGVGSVVDCPSLTGMTSVAIQLQIGAVLDTPNLVTFAGSSVSVGQGETFRPGPLTSIDNSVFAVEGGSRLELGANEYNWTYDPYRTSPTIFSADGIGSEILASSLKNIRIGHQINDNGSYRFYMRAINGGRIRLPSVSSIVGATSDDWFQFDVDNGGELVFGEAVIAGRTILNVDKPLSTIRARSIDLVAPTQLWVQNHALLSLQSSLSFGLTDDSLMATDTGIIEFSGASVSSLEVGGTDGGPAAFSSRNFGVGQLIVGSQEAPTNLRLVDERNNGRRGADGAAEALYVYGVDGVSLRLLSGSKLVIGNLNAHVLVNGQRVSLRSLIPAGRNAVAFDDGVIATTAGPRITNMVPRNPVLPTVASVDVTFDIPINPSSFTSSDVRLVGPSGSISVTSVQLAQDNTYRISFPTQSAHGAYTVRVGPGIADLSNLLPTMDQDGDGRAGESSEDVFVGTFAIDSRPPSVVAASGLNGWGEVTVCFDEPLDPLFGTNIANYLVNGVNPTNVILRTSGNMVSLQVEPLVGENLALAVQGVSDALGNTLEAAVLSTNLLSSQRAAIIGDPAARGAIAAACEEDGFDVIAGGSTISGNQDGFTYVYEPRTGDFDVRTRLNFFRKAAQTSEAGIMVREELTPRSRHAYVYAHPTDGANVLGGIGLRSTTGGPTVEWPGRLAPVVPLGVPNGWMRLQRIGDTFWAYYGTNGLDWVQYGEVGLNLPKSVFLGLATSANNANTAGSTTSVEYRDYGDYGPAILTSPESQIASNTLGVAFSVFARGVAPLKYQWFFMSTPVPNATNQTYSIASANSANEGDYFVVVSNSVGVVTSKVATLTVGDGGIGGFEADVGPRSNGNGLVSTIDWVQVGRFVAGLDSVFNFREFARADCAPRASLGDGRLTVSDWTQAGRYAAGLDGMTNAGGPRTPLALPPVPPAPGLATVGGASRSLSVVDAVVAPGGDLELIVKLEAQGDENAAGFSIQFDPSVLSYQGLIPGSAAQNAVIQVNDREVKQGRIGVMIAQGAGQSFGKESLELARIRMVAGSVRSVSTIRLSDTPVVRELASVGAEVQETSYRDGRVVVGQIPQLVASYLKGQVHLELWGEIDKTYRVEFSSDLSHWSSLRTLKATANPMVIVEPITGVSGYYRSVIHNP